MMSAFSSKSSMDSEIFNVAFAAIAEERVKVMMMVESLKCILHLFLSPIFLFSDDKDV